MSRSPDFSEFNPGLSENAKEISLFDPDSKDSGYAEDIQDENDHVSSPISSLDDNEATICFSPKDVLVDITPCKKLLPSLLSNKKRLFSNPSPCDSPSVVASHSLKRLKIFDLECDDNGDACEPLPLDFSDKILVEASDDELSSLNSEEVQKNIVKKAVEKSEEEQLIGDFSKSYALPLIGGSHPDLKSISVETMKDVLEGKYGDLLHSVMIIDSRYPYEFKGGHIRGALNLFMLEDCLDLLNAAVKPKDERHILVFHCEFSKERGPNMVRSLRQEDRTRNTRNYPKLTYPEIYILEGGYKRFYERFPEYCDPKAYKQMLHPDHSDEMRLFRKKSKTSENVLRTGKKKASAVRHSGTVRKFLSNDF